MNFSGKKYRRVGCCENIDTIMRATNTSEKVIQLLKSNAPVFSFTRIDEKTMRFHLQTEDRFFVYSFTLGEEHEMERRDGTKLRLLMKLLTSQLPLSDAYQLFPIKGVRYVKLTYTLEGDNILNQTIKQPDGKVSYFRREFSEKDTKMTITNEGSNMKAVIYYEVVE